jgi:hypothetical protein
METGMKSFNLHRNQKYKNKIWTKFRNIIALRYKTLEIIKEWNVVAPLTKQGEM